MKQQRTQYNRQMNKFYLFYLFWLIPLYMAFIVYQQSMVYKSTIDTYENGETILADIIDFDVKQIAAQSNGYVVIRFDVNGQTQQRKLSLSIQMAREIMDVSTVPIRYKEDAFQEIVLMPLYEIQRTTAYFNVSIAAIGFLITFVIAILFHRYANKRRHSDDEDVLVEWVK